MVIIKNLQQVRTLDNVRDPRWVESNTDSEDTNPRQARPSNDNAKSLCTGLRGDKVAPKCRKSDTDMLAARHEELLRGKEALRTATSGVGRSGVSLTNLKAADADPS